MSNDRKQLNSRPARILIVANKRLPDNDYRINYRDHTRLADMVYGLPDRPSCVTPGEYVRFGFAEGISLGDLINLWKLLVHLRRYGKSYDLVHFFSTKLVLLGPLCAALAGVPCISTVTGFGRTFNRNEFRYHALRPIYLMVLRLALSLTRVAFFQNRGDMRWLAEKLPAYSNKFHWIGSAVEGVVIGDKNFSHQPLAVLMVARLMPDKGVPLFLEAARRLCGQRIQFRLAGPPSDGQSVLYRQVIEAQEQGFIQYLGELEQFELARHYREAHVFAFPSRGEGLPRVMLEAGYALLCPLASDIPAHRDLIADQRGALIDSGDELESFISRLLQLRDDRATLERNARNYQRHIVSQYAMKVYATRMDDHLSRLLEIQHPSSALRNAA